MSRKFSFCICLVICVVVACNRNEDKATHRRLSQWDAVLDSIPRQVADSLRLLDPHKLSRENRAYHNLLKVISDDKNYVDFTSDSLINATVAYYQRHRPTNENYMRALAYQGIVRTRMGINDTTVFEPLKEADRQFKQQLNPSPSTGYLIYYFLGNIHYNNVNYQVANNYFEQALHYAAQQNDSIHLFDTYLALYWNEMNQRNFETAKKYLNLISAFEKKWPEKDFLILNAKSIYYDTQGLYYNALQCEKEKLKLGGQQRVKVNLSRIYFSISDRYNSLNRLDSAMHYAQMAVKEMDNPDFRYNYLLYDNIANIAEKQHDYANADRNRKKSFDFYQQSVKERLNTQVMELEKKYDLSEAENAVLRSRQNTLLIAVFSLLLLVLLIGVVMINARSRKSARMKILKAEHEAQKHALKADLLAEEARRRIWLIQLYGFISDRLTSLQEKFEALSQRYVTSHPAVFKSMNKILHETGAELRDISTTLTPDSETFYYNTHIRDDGDFFNDNEKLLLMLLTCKATNRQIATFMNTSVESIRARKSQLKKKMAENAMDTQAFFS